MRIRQKIVGLIELIKLMSLMELNPQKGTKQTR